jgi:phosphoribosylpyrophosphate synthetase
MSSFPYYKDMRTGVEYRPHFHRFSDGAIVVDCSNVPEVIDILQIVVPHNLPVHEVYPLTAQMISAGCPLYKYVELYMPYFPYARADRKFGERQNFGLSFFVQRELKPLLTCLGGNTNLVVHDVHNLETFSILIKGNGNTSVTNISQVDGLKEYLHYIAPDVGINKPTYVVAPDKGAALKAKEVAQYFNVPLIQATKTRDLVTGKITDMTVQLPFGYNHNESNTMLIVDDICDGGGTFEWLAEKLPADATKILYVTHGIFSKGKEQLLKQYDEVHALFDWSK